MASTVTYVSWLTSFCLLMGREAVRAQCPPNANYFTGSLRTNVTVGCVPLRVEARSDLIGVQNVRYVYEYDGKTSAPTTPASSHVYDKPGQYTLVQFSEKEGLQLRACTAILVYDTLPPAVVLTACGTRVRLDVTDRTSAPFGYDYFQVDWGDGPTDTVRSVGSFRGEHVFAGTDPRRIWVRGIHRSGSCGGTTSVAFTPDQPATIRNVEPVGSGAAGSDRVRLYIQNAGGQRLTVQQRVGNEAFQNVGQSVPAGPSPTLDVAVDTALTTCYRLVPTPDCPGSPSPEVCYTPPADQPAPVGSEYHFPDAFSPNGDGLNDTFGPLGAGPTGAYELIIYDRWGRVVFFTVDFRHTWNGSVNNQSAPVGTYAYQVVTHRPGEPVRRQSGKVQLVR